MFNTGIKKNFDDAAPVPRDYNFEDSKNFDKDDINSKKNKLYGGVSFDYN